MALNGYEKNEANIQNAVYRVRDAGTADTYKRIHFETSSKMVHDATDVATANMIARRDANGSIKFNAVAASGTVSANAITVTSTGLVSNLNADSVDSCHVSDTTTTKTNLWTADKINTTKADKAVTVTGTNGLAGGGSLSANRTITHATKTPSKTTDKAGTSGLAVKSISFDSYGHPNSYVEVDLDYRYPTKTQVSTDIANAGVTVARDLIAKAPSNRADNGNSLVMQNFTIQYNATSKALEFIFV